MAANTIWIINQYAGSPYHGMNFRSYYLAKELIDIGYKVYIISGSYSHLYTQKPKIKGLFTFEKIDEIDYVWIKVVSYKSSKSIMRLINMFDFFFKLFLLPKNKLPKPDFIMLSSLPLLPVVHARAWSKKYSAKFIFEVRDIWPLTLQLLGGFSRYNPLVMLLSWFERYGYRHADSVVSMLPNAVQHMKRVGLSEGKYTWLPNGTTLLDESHRCNYLEEFPDDKFIVGYIGTIGISNNLDIVVDIASKVQSEQVHFAVVGDGGEKNRIEKKVQTLGLKNITFYPKVHKNQVSSVVEKFDLCLITPPDDPLYRYGLSANKYFDYMASGKPIFEVVNSNFTPVLDCGCGFHFEPAPPEVLASEITKISQLSNDYLSELGKKGRFCVEHKYNYSVIGKNLHALLQSLKLS